MRTTTTNRWVWVFAGALPAVGLGAGCGDDTATTGTTSGGGGFGGFGGGDATQASSSAAGSPTSSSSGGTPTSSSSSGNPTSTASSSSGGEGGQGGTGGTGGTGGAEPACGNGLLDDGEACDGSELGDASCEGEGFFTGTISCTDDCELDVSECSNCGNDVADAGEDCDGSDLDGTECSDIDDFVTGTLGCTDECTFDTLQCVGAECNNNVVDPGEDCEEGMLEGETCITQGFVSGTLDCTNCQFDTAACESCGDDTINGDDVCDGDDLGGATCADAGNFTGGTLGCAAGCAAFDTSLCTNLPLPGVGELVITEIMVNPNGSPPIPNADDTREWFEITNPSGATTFQLNGCEITSNNDGVFTVAGDFEVAPGESVTFAKSAPGFTADFSYPDDFAFSNSSQDFVSITCDGTQVDIVTYSTALGFAVPNGATLSLDPGFIDATDNDDGANWCDATTIGAGFTGGDFGTPGGANPACGAGAFTIDFCELQSPLTINDTEGTAVTVFGQVRIDGLTDLTVGNDLNALVIASLGYGDDGTDPASDPSWQFTPAAPNAGYNDASPGYTVNQDEYQATFNIPAAAGSPYDYAFRFSGDGGDTWTYCDSNGGVYAPVDAGQMTSNPSTQTFDLYFSEYVEGDPGTNKALEIYNNGDDDIDLSACQIRLYRNGAATFTPANTLNLSGTILAGGTWVICSTGQTHFDPALCDATEGTAMDFNGDDALELVCSSTVQDVIGQHDGNDPGAGWGSDPTDTVNVMLRRNCPHVADTDGTDAFVPTAAWTGTNYAIATADDDLGLFSGCP